MVVAAALGAAVVVGLSRRQAAAALALEAVGYAPLAQSPAAWHPDPTGRYDHRYWDGQAWTEHVARAGRSGTDPV
jgi:uncharacterized membrane protein YphA (DoxX/SURF4 family)